MSLVLQWRFPLTTFLPCFASCLSWLVVAATLVAGVVLSVSPETMFLVCQSWRCVACYHCTATEPVQTPAAGNNMELHRHIHGAIQLRVGALYNKRHLLLCTNPMLAAPQGNNSSATCQGEALRLQEPLQLPLCCVHASSIKKQTCIVTTKPQPLQ